MQAPVMYQGASASVGQPVMMQGGSVVAGQAYGGSVAAGPPIVLQGASAVAGPGASVSVPQYAYPAGSVEVQVYGQNTNVQRVFQRQLVQGQVVTTPIPQQPMTYSSGPSLTPEQLKLIFPMGPPENFAPAPAVAESQQLVMPATMSGPMPGASVSMAISGAPGASMASAVPGG